MSANPQLQNLTQIFNTNDTVTATSLNNLVSLSTLTKYAVTEQTEKTTPVNDDMLLGYDSVDDRLIKISKSNLIPKSIIANSLTAENGSDVTLTPNDGTIVTGSSFTSANGLTTVVTTSVAHGLSVGQVVTTSASTQTGYNGTHRITAVTTTSPFTFTYVMTTAGTIGSGTISYTKQGVVKNPEHEVINGNLYVDGSAVITGSTTQVGNVTQTGNLNIGGNLAVTGTTTANLTTTSTAVTQASTDSSTKIATTAFVNSLSPIKAWVNFNGIGSTVGANLTVNASFNVTNVVYEGTGVYSINFTNAISDANYAILVNGQIGSTGGCPTVGLHTTGGVGNNPTVKTTTKVIIASVKDSTGANLNQANISVMIIR